MRIAAAVRKDAKWVVLARVLLLIVLTAGCGLWAHNNLEATQSETEEERAKLEEIKGESNAVEKGTAEALVKQSEQFQSWAVLLLTGIIAVLITTKVHRTPGAQWAYVALGPAAVFLVVALDAGYALTKTYTYFMLLNNFSDFQSLAGLVQLQSDLFLYAIVCVSIFAAWFLLLIVLGQVQTFETK